MIIPALQLAGYLLSNRAKLQRHYSRQTMQQIPSGADVVMAAAQTAHGMGQTFGPGSSTDLTENEYFQRGAVLTVTGPYAGFLIFEIVDPFDVLKELEDKLSYFDQN